MQVSKILWGALTFSMFLYGIVLFVTGKISTVFLPSGAPSTFETIAIAGNMMALVTFFIFKTKVVPEKDPQKKLTSNIICWALNEAIVVWGFAAVFTTDNGNAFFYLTNLAMGVTANVIMFPRK